MYPIKKLSEITSLITKGSTPTTYGYSFLSEGINFIKIENISNGTISKPSLSAFISKEAHLSQKRSILEDGDFLVSIAGTIGSIALVTKDILPANTNQALAIVRGYQDFVNKDFLRYIFLSSLSKGFKNKARGGALQNISLEDIKNIEIPLPPLSTQSKIVAKLDEVFGNIDHQISLLKANIEDVESMRKSAIESIFDYHESAIIQKLVQKTETWNPISISNETFEYIDISSIDNSRFILTETKVISGKEAPSRAKKLVNENDIIFATTRPSLKNIAVIDRDLKNLTCSTGFCVLRTKSELLNFQYLFYYLISDIVANKISPMIRGAGYPAISDKDLLSIDIPLPPLPRQHEIVEHLDRVFAQTAELRSGYEAQIRDLETLRQSLLEEAFAGRLVSED